ncbi:MAG: hypothetical protein WBF38_08330 [Nitrosotalea sp.]
MVRTKHTVYLAIVKAIQDGRLKEPFSLSDFRYACKGFGSGTYKAFLAKHRIDNPGHYAELFVRTARGRFKLLKPIKYDS